MSQPNNVFDDLSPEFAQALVRLMGGTSAVAKRFEISCAAVSQWKRRGLSPTRRDLVQSRYRLRYEQAKAHCVREALRGESRLAA